MSQSAPCARARCARARPTPSPRAICLVCVSFVTSVVAVARLLPTMTTKGNRCLSCLQPACSLPAACLQPACLLTSSFYPGNRNACHLYKTHVGYVLLRFQLLFFPSTPPHLPRHCKVVSYRHVVSRFLTSETKIVTPRDTYSRMHVSWKWEKGRTAVSEMRGAAAAAAAAAGCGYAHVRMFVVQYAYVMENGRRTGRGKRGSGKSAQTNPSFLPSFLPSIRPRRSHFGPDAIDCLSISGQWQRAACRQSKEPTP